MSGIRNARADELPSRSTGTWTKYSIVENGVVAGVEDVMRHSEVGESRGHPCFGEVPV